VPVESRVRAQQDLGAGRAGGQLLDGGQRVGDQAFGSSRRATRSLAQSFMLRGSGKARLVYPGARLAREEPSTPVAMSW
jgi:hypothetical protein